MLWRGLLPITHRGAGHRYSARACAPGGTFDNSPLFSLPRSSRTQYNAAHLPPRSAFDAILTVSRVVPHFFDKTLTTRNDYRDSMTTRSPSRHAALHFLPTPPVLRVPYATAISTFLCIYAATCYASHRAISASAYLLSPNMTRDAMAV